MLVLLAYPETFRRSFEPFTKELGHQLDCIFACFLLCCGSHILTSCLFLFFIFASAGRAELCQS